MNNRFGPSRLWPTPTAVAFVLILGTASAADETWMPSFMRRPIEALPATKVSVSYQTAHRNIKRALMKCLPLAYGFFGPLVGNVYSELKLADLTYHYPGTDAVAYLELIGAEGEAMVRGWVFTAPLGGNANHIVTSAPLAALDGENLDCKKAGFPVR